MRTVRRHGSAVALPRCDSGEKSMKVTFLFPAFVLFSALAAAQDYSDPFGPELEEESIDAEYRDPFETEETYESQADYEDPFAYDDPFSQNLDGSDESAASDQDGSVQGPGGVEGERDYRNDRGSGFDDPFTIGVDERDMRPVHNDPFTEGVNEAYSAPDYEDTFSADFDDFNRPQQRPQ